MSTIIRETRPAVKSTRPARTPRKPFGVGLGERKPVHRLPGDVTPADLIWWAAQTAEQSIEPAGWEEEMTAEEERRLEEMFAEYLAMDRLSNGLDA